MKKLISTLMGLVLLVMFFGTSVFAAEQSDMATVGAPINISRFSNNGVLVDSVTFLLNEDGTVTEVPADAIQPYRYMGTDAVVFNFYDYSSGSSVPYFKVVMEARATPGHVFKSHTMEILPSGNWFNWFKHDVSHSNTSYFSDTMDYHYANGVPSSFTVQVKASVTTSLGTWNVPQHTLSNPIRK